MAYEHRGNAIKGLQEAIGSFSRENSDAVLAASLLLSWQATEWFVKLCWDVTLYTNSSLQARLDTTNARDVFCNSPRELIDVQIMLTN